MILYLVYEIIPYFIETISWFIYNGKLHFLI